VLNSWSRTTSSPEPTSLCTPPAQATLSLAATTSAEHLTLLPPVPSPLRLTRTAWLPLRQSSLLSLPMLDRSCPSKGISSRVFPFGCKRFRISSLIEFKVYLVFCFACDQVECADSLRSSTSRLFMLPFLSSQIDHKELLLCVTFSGAGYTRVLGFTLSTEQSLMNNISRIHARFLKLKLLSFRRRSRTK